MPPFKPLINRLKKQALAVTFIQALYAVIR